MDQNPARGDGIPLPERIGNRPKPRLLILDLEDSDLRKAISHLAPTVRIMASSDLSKIRQPDWDVAVVFGDGRAVTEQLYLIQFGGTFGGSIVSQQAGSILTILATSRATQFEIPDALPDSIRPLVRSSLVKLVESRSPNSVMRAGLPDNTNDYKPEISQPFMSDADGNVLAGCFARASNSARCWWLPAGIESPEKWVAAALADWANVDSETFPGAPSWQDREEWQTPAELGLRSEISATRDRYEALLGELRHEELVLGTELEAAVAEANVTARRLLTAQGEELVDEVQATLEELGFNVTNVDKEITNPGDRREDLRVTTPDQQEWVAISEVRGYKRGAQLNDLMRINRFVIRYLQETGKVPDNAWYIVNHDLDQDPTVRPSPLASNPLEVQTFAEDNGLIIDSRFLFRIRMKVRSGEMRPEEARARLIGVTSLIEE